MINMLRKGIKFSIQRVYFPQSYFESRHYGKRFNSIGKFKSLTFQLRAIYFHTFAVDMSVYCILHVSQDLENVLNLKFMLAKEIERWSVMHRAAYKNSHILSSSVQLFYKLKLISC